MTTTEIDLLLHEIKKELDDSDKLLQSVPIEDPEIPE